MRQSLTTVLLALALALFVAAGIAVAGRLPLAASGAHPASNAFFFASLLAIAAFSLVPASAAIVLGEARRIRGLPYWLMAGLLIALAGYLSLIAWTPNNGDDLRTAAAFMTFAATGLAAGYVYWTISGRHAGRLAAAFELAAITNYGAAADGRCRTCTAVSLILGLVPLAFLGWAAIDRSVPDLVASIEARAESDARTRLADAGLAALTLKIDDGVGIVMGKAPAGTTTAEAFEKSQVVLRPMVGMPGIVAHLENAIASDSAAARP
jgi:hypothetical protein